MDEYIKCEDAINALLGVIWDDEETLREILYSIPAADVEPVVHAEWLDAEESDLVGEPIETCYCSHCKQARTHWRVRYPRCHVCGARMSNYNVKKDYVV